MKKIYRTMLLFSATVIFLALAPLLVLYALGYRFNTTTVDPLPVGMLQIDSQPNQATVEVNEAVRGESPQTISNLVPGSTIIKVTRPDYTGWEKRITIEPGRATEFRDIRLFRQSPASVTLARQIQLITLSPNRQRLAAVDYQNVLQVFDEEGISITGPIKLPQTPQTALWSPDSASLLLTYRHLSAQVVALTARPHLKTIRALPSSVLTTVWDPRIPSRLLLLNAAHELWAYNHATDTAQLLLNNVATFATTSRTILAGQTDGSLAFLTLQSQLINRHRPALPAPLARILATPDGQVALLTTDDHLYYLTSNQQLLTIAESAQQAAWSPDGALLYVQTGPNEISVWNAIDNRLPWLPIHTLQLVIRLSRPLHDPQWFAGSRHLIYQADDEIHITEIDTRDHATDYILGTTNRGQAQATVGRDGKVVFYLKQERNQTLLVKATIVY